METVSAIKDETITVSQLNKLAKTLLENNMPICWIQGEISGVKSYSHVYFDLKDESAKISCVMFASFLPSLDFELKSGLKVEVRGRITIYPANGSYQINVERIRQVGMGELWEAYHRLLLKLREEGIFDVQYKKTIPVFPKSIGVITSKEGAVIRDVITTLRRRMPNIPIIVYHTAVQGQDAAMQISKAIRLANKRVEVDVLIVCRGGGSPEDLWCFNEEVVAREVFSSQIPIISAVGHETDTTIIDYVSDLRAPTPTAAAELVAKAKLEWEMEISKLHMQLVHKFEYIMNDRRQKLDIYYRQLKILNPINQLKERITKINNLESRLFSLIIKVIVQNKAALQLLQLKLDPKKINTLGLNNKLNHLSNRLNLGITNKLRIVKNKLANITTQLELLNPHNVLNRGYAIVRSIDGKVVCKDKDVKHHQRVEILLKEDTLSAIIDKKYNSEQTELL
ncbi:MAG: exodeoxyribonuclease VII large subunit [Neisseriaceae bacterium]